jgi:NitT/TauT family transport system ATP-binding protein
MSSKRFQGTDRYVATDDLRIAVNASITLERPRDLMDLRTTPAFVDLYRAIWAVLRGEVIKSQRTVAHGRA